MADAFQRDAFQRNAFQFDAESVIATTNYSRHPVNCIMSGTEVLKDGWKRRIEWDIPKPNTVVNPTARRTQTMQIMRPRGLTKSGWQ